MRILHTLHSVNPAAGGVVEAVQQMASVHRRLGHRVEIASLDAPDASWVQTSPTPVHALGSGRTSYGYSAAFTPWLQRHRGEYDVLVVNGLWQYHGLGTWRAARASGMPYVVFPHGMLDPWFRRAYPGKHLKKVIYWRLLEHRVLGAARAVFFTCEEERELARKTFRPYRCREIVTPLGTRLPDEAPELQREAFLARFPHLRGQRLILFLGRVHDKKGCELLVRGFAEAAKSNAGAAGLHLVMAGPPSSDAYLLELQRLVASVFPGIEPPVTWTGMLSGNAKWGAYRASEVFVLPSHQENFGLAVVEALACGLPVLISNRVNIWREISADGGGLVENDDQAGTTRLLHRWLTMAAADQATMRAAARRSFVQRFEIERAAENFLERLTELVGAPKRTGEGLPLR